MKIPLFPTLLLLAAITPCLQGADHWKVFPDPATGIWSYRDLLLPLGQDEYSDHLEMGGRAVDAIVEWKVARQPGMPSLNRRVRFPMLRSVRDDTHSSLSVEFNSKDDPLPLVDGAPLAPWSISQVAIRGGLEFEGKSGTLEIHRSVFPSTDLPALIERWEFINCDTKPLVLTIPRSAWENKIAADQGKWAAHITRTEWIGTGTFTLAPGEHLTAGLVFSAREDANGDTPADAPVFPDIDTEWAARQTLAARLNSNLALFTPDEALNRMFAMAKLRSVESIAATRGGLLQGPGGYNNYNAALWCNDNAEYMAPLHAYLGDPAGMEASRNAYLWLAKYMNPEFKPLPSSIVAEGRGTWDGAGDRGDAAMVAQGAARFALASGDPALARELWPLIEWCLEYCERQKTADGVIASRSDELEGRFSFGKTNLATSSLTYDALVSAAMLARDLGLPAERVETYQKRAADLRAAIDKVFAAKISGFDTYRYHDGLENLRAWICLPLAYGILDRAPGTLDALYSPDLWTADGLRTDAQDKTFWDRSTLFALRATFIAGDTQRGLDHLAGYTRRRLLGDHVPYAVEAYPEGAKSQLSGESCLYMRVFIEGLLGIRPTGLKSFDITPHLPASWPIMTLKQMHDHGCAHTVSVSRVADGIQVLVYDTNWKVISDTTLPEGQTHQITLPE
ncbi:MAG: hypothetical protein JWO82_1189 [Akkermansiaceae bacterium]|nr:hypothetical protein [Akkermansiaceae bacterium]